MLFKRIMAFALCAVLVLGLAACGSAEETQTQPPAASAVITTDAEQYTVTVDQMVPITATLEGVDGTLTYASKDETIATVNKYGKVVGISAGSTQIVISAPDGTTKTVEIIVGEPKFENVLRVALNVLYNDSALGCTNTEYGPYVEIYEDGQYTVTFDATMHLSESARNMGVTGLDNLTAIFLYDQAVRDGDQKTSSAVTCDIRWDSIVVNGQELTITSSEFKSAIKSSGIFDTNDPMNAWDGSAVEEVTVDTENHVLNISVEDPVTITITFTIRNLTFAE